MKYDNVQLNVKFTKSGTRSDLNVITDKNPTGVTNENISLTLGKISKWYEALVPTGGSSGKILAWNSAGTAKWSDPLHPTITKSADTTSTASPAHGGTFTTVDSVTRDGNGHVTKINTKTVTLPSQYTHPTYSRSDTSSTVSPAHGGTFTAIDSVTSSNGHVTSVNLKTITLPAQYTHPTYTSKSSGLYKITVDGTGHVSGTAAVTKSDIPALDYVPNTKSGVITAINLLDEATANITSDDAHFISQENNGSTTNYYRRKFSGLWGYINGKISAETTGSGNAVTSVSYSNGKITATKGSTFSLSDHTHTYTKSKDNYTFTSSTLPNSFDFGISAGFVDRNDGVFPSYGSVLTVRTYSGGGGTLQLYAPYSPTYGGTRLMARFGNYDSSSGNSWTTLKEIAWLSDTIKVTRGSSQSTATSGYWAAMCNSTQTGSPVLPTTNKWWHVISMDWSTDVNNWISQLAVATQDGSGVWWRRNNTGGTSIDSFGWNRLAEGDSSGVAKHAAILDYSHTNEINFSGGANPRCYFNYRNADTDVAGAIDAIDYRFCNYSNDTSKTTITAAIFNGTATLATSANILNKNNAAGATTTGVQYANGRLTVGTADGNAVEGSNASYKLWSYPAGGTWVGGGSANIQNLRLYWSSTYFRDIFISPNNYDIYHRSVAAGTAQPWRKVLDSGNYTSYALPRNIKHIHTASGTEGSAGWVKIARITVTNLYANHPMTFTIAQRGLMQYRIHLVFVNNGSVAAAAISEFIIARDNSWVDTNNNPRAYIIKPSDGIFDLYIRKTENYDHIFVVDFTKADGMRVTVIQLLGQMFMQLILK